MIDRARGKEAAAGMARGNEIALSFARVATGLIAGYTIFTIHGIIYALITCIPNPTAIFAKIASLISFRREEPMDRKKLAQCSDHDSAICFIVPPHIYQHMARHATNPAHRALARRALAHRAALHLQREQSRLDTQALLASGVAPAVAAAAKDRKVFTAGDTVSLPGTPERAEGQAATGDAAADEAYDGSGTTWDFYNAVFGRNSVDGRGLALLSTVHYDQRFDNAFWNGSQMVYGDGDQTIFDRFTKCLDVIGHELTHGVTQFTAGLSYHGQSGALNESISDVFGSMIKQKAANQTSANADWLIGAGLFIAKPDVNLTALRSMKAPGTAYNDPTTIGADPQPDHMSKYKQLPDTADGDWGGVHINSGIPNKAFFETATRFGGNSWDQAGKIWYDVLTGGALSSTASFQEFRDATVASATRLFSREGGGFQTEAWGVVGL